MRILITGVPGVGKTTIAKKICKKLDYEYLNEQDFALKHNIGSYNKSGELELPLKELQHKLSKYLKNRANVVLEGHVLCEIKLPLDIVFILIADSLILEKRLRRRKYSEEKILDNLFCAETQYCKKQVYKKYGKKIVHEIRSEKRLNEVVDNIISFIKSRQKRGK